MKAALSAVPRGANKELGAYRCGIALVMAAPINARSSLQGTYFEKVPTSEDLALIGAAITSAIPQR